MRQLALPVRLRASSVFESFYPGANADIVRQLLALTTGTKASVVWLYGPASVGKTHLLQSLCARAGQQNLAATYWPLREVAGLYAELLSGCESLAFTCMDDFQHIAGHAGWERAVFRLYTELEDHGGQLVIAADGPPASLRIQLRDLASRLAAGVVLRVQTLSDDEQMRALALRAHRLGLELPPDTAQFMARRLPRDMAVLCEVLDTLDQASLVTQRRLTIPFVRDVLEERDARDASQSVRPVE